MTKEMQFCKNKYIDKHLVLQIKKCGIKTKRAQKVDASNTNGTEICLQYFTC